MGGWLGAVAHRLALGARSDLTRQNRRETPITTLAGQTVRRGLSRSKPGCRKNFTRWPTHLPRSNEGKLGRLVKDELLRLPEKYRSPVVLCYFEGRTHEEAARQLGYPAGSMSRRLKRAQALLRRRLIHRGFSLAIGCSSSAASPFLSAWSICRRPRRDAADRSVGDVVARAAHGRRDGNPDRDRPDRSTAPTPIATVNRSWPWPGERPRWPRRSNDTSPEQAIAERLAEITAARCGSSAVLCLPRPRKQNDPARRCSRPPGGSDASCLGCHETVSLRRSIETGPQRPGSSG